MFQDQRSKLAPADFAGLKPLLSACKLISAGSIRRLRAGSPPESRFAVFSMDGSVHP